MTSYPDKPSLTSDMAQHPGVEERVRHIWALFDEAKEAQMPERASWDTYYDFWSGNHWKNVRRAGWQSKVAYNYCFSTVETIVPVMADSQMKWIAQPVEESDVQLVDSMNTILDSIKNYNDMQTQQFPQIRGTTMYGTGIWKAVWDEYARGGIGEVLIQRYLPHHVFVDPTALDFDDANYVICAQNVSIGFLKRVFGPKADKVRPGVREANLSLERDPQPYDENTFYKDQIVQASGGGRPFELKTAGGGDPLQNYSISRQATLIEAWIRENGTIYVYYIANGTFLHRCEAPLGDRMPFIKVTNYEKDGHFYGMSELEQIIPIQKGVNLLLNQLLDIMRITANPPLLYSVQSNFDPAKYSARPGVCIGVVGDVSQIKWLDPPAVDPKIFGMYDILRQAIDIVTGVQDVTQGRRPTGVTAASAIAELQEAAQTRIRFKIKSHSNSYRKLGHLVSDYVKYGYDQPRVIRLTNKEGGWNFLKINDYAGVNPQTAQETIVNQISQGNFDIDLGVGAELPVSRLRYLDLALQMFQLGALPRRELLKQAAYPDWERISQEMDQRDQQAAMAQQAGAAPPGAAPQGNPQKLSGPSSPEQAEGAMSGVPEMSELLGG